MSKDAGLWKTNETIDMYTLSKDSIQLTVGELIDATKGGEKHFMIKKIKKTPENQKFIDKEEENMKKASHSALVPLISVFEDKENVYHVFQGVTGTSIQQKCVNEGAFFEGENATNMAIQFLNFLDALHKEGIYYLRPTVDNCFYTDKNALKIFGLDADAEGSTSFILKNDSEVTDITDYLSLAEFISFIMCGKPSNQRTKLPEEAENCIANLSKKDANVRKSYNPRKDKFLTPTLHIVKEDDSIQVDRFKVDWSDGGLCLGFGETLTGWRNGFVFESGDDSIKIGAEGFEYEGESCTFKIGPDGLECEGNTDMPSIFQTKLTINADGFYTAVGEGTHEQQSVKLGPSGLNYTVGPHSLGMTDAGIECSFPTDSYKQGFEDGNFCININNFFVISVGKTGFMIRIGTAQLEVNTEGMIITLAPIQLKILLAGVIQFLAGGLDFSISIKEGISLTLGSFLFKLASSMRLECEGFIVTVDGDGFNLENTNAPIDFSSFAKNIPKISFKAPEVKAPSPPPPPPVPMPELPSVPSIPSCDIYAIFTRADPTGPALERSEYVDDDQVVLEGFALKTRMLSRKRRMLVLTKSHVVKYFTEHFEFLRGEIKLCKDSTVEIKNDVDLVVTNDAGRGYNLKFNTTSERDEWAAALNKSIDEVKAEAPVESPEV